MHFVESSVLTHPKVVDASDRLTHFDWFHATALGVLTPLFLFPTSDVWWTLTLIPLLMTMRLIVQGRLIPSTPLDWPIFILVWQVLLTALTVTPVEAFLPKALGLLFAVAVYYAVVSLLRRPWLLKVGLLVFAAGGAVFAVFGLLGMVTSNLQGKRMPLLSAVRERLGVVDFGLPGAEGGLGPNPVAGILLLFIPIAFSLTWLAKRHSVRDPGVGRAAGVGCGIVLVVSLFVLILTQSRNAWAALVVSSATTVLWVVRSKARLRVQIAAGAGLAVVLLLAYVALVGSGQLGAAKLELVSKVEGRLQAWTVGLEAMVRYPITGIGLNQLRHDMALGYNRAHAHNHLIHTGAEMGLPGFVALLALYFLVARMTVGIWTTETDDWIRYGALGLGAGQFAHALFGLADSIPLGAKPGGVFWMSLALLVGLYHATRGAAPYPITKRVLS